MIEFNIHSNKDLLRFIEIVEQKTEEYFASGENGIDDLEVFKVVIHSDLDLSGRLIDVIGAKHKYFRGEVEGNGHILTIASLVNRSLFSSMYHSTIRNLKFKHSRGSRGLLLADDANECTLENVTVEGHIIALSSNGGLVRLGGRNKFINCNFDANVISSGRDKFVEQDPNKPMHFGGLIGVDSGGTVFEGCKASGSIISEVRVGGLVAKTRDSSFKKCIIDNLTIKGNRELGLMIGYMQGTVEINDTTLDNSKVEANVFGGYIVGKSAGRIIMNGVSSDNLNLSSDTASSFIGGVAGTSPYIEMTNCYLAGNIYANFVLAGICPDADHVIMKDSNFDFTVTATGYQPMMTHAYELVRDEYLTTRGIEPVIEMVNVDSNVQLIEIEVTGFLNPFEEALV